MGKGEVLLKLLKSYRAGLLNCVPGAEDAASKKPILSELIYSCKYNQNQNHSRPVSRLLESLEI